VCARACACTQERMCVCLCVCVCVCLCISLSLSLFVCGGGGRGRGRKGGVRENTGRARENGVNGKLVCLRDMVTPCTYRNTTHKMQLLRYNHVVLRYTDVRTEHTYIYMHTYIRIYVCMYIRVYVCTYIHVYMHTCIHAYINTYKHTYIRIRFAGSCLN
jgi:hypothetical protein